MNTVKALYLVFLSFFAISNYPAGCIGETWHPFDGVSAEYCEQGAGSVPLDVSFSSNQPYYGGYPNYLSIGHTEGKGFGYRAGYTTLGLFWSPLDLVFDGCLPFFDGKVHFFNNGKAAANLGGGIRWMNASSVIFGVNAYYDSRQISKHCFNQLGIGFEVLNTCLDFRLNGYLPLGSKEHRSSVLFDDFIGDFWAVCCERRTAMRGIDAEIGKWLKTKCACDYYGIYVAGGVYYYSHSDGRTSHFYTLSDSYRLLASSSQSTNGKGGRQDIVI